MRSPKPIACIAISLLLIAPTTRAASAATLPATGTLPKELAALDAALLGFMRDYSISAGTCAVMREGKIIFERGYGWGNRERTQPIKPDVRMRVASVTKVFTATAIKQLIDAGKLTEDTKAFPLLGFDIAKTPGAEPRLARITIGHLLRHEGGWDREKSFDPMFADDRVKNSFGLKGPPSPRDFVHFMVSQPLQFDPGTRSAYSNFGYCILGLVIEKVTGKTFGDHLRENILNPLHLTSIEPGRGNGALPGEIWYEDPGAAGINMNAHFAGGGLVAGAGDLCRFMDKYWINGEPRRRRTGQRWVFFGSLPGTTAMVLQRPDGVNVAALFNHRARDYKSQNEELRKRSNAALDNIQPLPK